MAKDNISSEIYDFLQEYNREMDEAVRGVFNEVAKETAADLRANSKKKTGKYSQGWTFKTQSSVGALSWGAVVYNKTVPQLTHLLERGHLIVNQYGVYGRTNGDRVIEAAKEKANAELMSRLRSIL